MIKVEQLLIDLFHRHFCWLNQKICARSIKVFRNLRFYTSDIRIMIVYSLFAIGFLTLCISAQNHGLPGFSAQPDFSDNKLLSYVSRIKKPPKGRKNLPLRVKIGLYMESLGNFQETHMSFDVDLYLYMSWKDSSLHHPGHDLVMINDEQIRKEMWVPDLYFSNARHSYFHHVTVPNFNFFVAPDGTISYSSRITASVACNLDLENFPMDTQVCRIRMLSYAYIAERVHVSWFKHDPILLNPEIELPAFSITNLTAEYCNGTYRYARTDISSKKDKFSCLDAKIYLRRALGYHIVQSYIPTGLIVIISWVSFCIDRRAVPARVTLSFTTLLTLSTLGNGLRYALPQVSYAKALDFWFGACMVFVFLALIEFAIVNNYMRKSEKFEKLSNKYSSAKEEVIKLPYYQHSHQEMLKFKSQSMLLDRLIGDSPKSTRSRLFSSFRRFSTRDNDSGSDECYTPISDSISSNGSQGSVKKVINPDEKNLPTLDEHGNPIAVENGDGTQFITITKKEKDLRKRNVVPDENMSIQYLEVAQLLSRRALNIDRISRYIFPIAFLIFNLLYWFYYLVVKAK